MHPQSARRYVAFCAERAETVELSKNAPESGSYYRMFATESNTPDHCRIGGRDSSLF